MDGAVWGALITAVASVICQLIISSKNKRENSIKDAVKDAHMEDRLNVIEKKLDEHNGYAAKFADLSGAIIELRADIGWIRGTMNDGK